MASPAPAGATKVFALSPRNPGDHGDVVRYLLLVPLVALLGLGCEAVYDALAGRTYGRTYGDGPGYGEWVLVAISAIGAGILVYAVLALAPGATSCVWGLDRFILKYPGGREPIFTWDSPGFRLRLVKYADSNGRTTYEINQGIPVHNPVAAELCAPILSEATRRGLGVRTQVTPYWSGKMVATDITRPRAQVSSLSS